MAGSLACLACIAFAVPTFAQTPARAAVAMKLDGPKARVYVSTLQPHAPSNAPSGHVTNRLLVYLDDGVMTRREGDRPVETIPFKRGDVRWRPSSGAYVAENISDHAIRILEVDLKGAPSGPTPSTALDAPLALAPMAGMTDTAFRRLVKRRGGCGLVVTEMVSAEGLVRGIDRTLEFAEYTPDERPISIQIFGGDPAKMAEAARIVESMGADILATNAKEIRRRLTALRGALEEWDARLAAAQNDPIIGRIDIERRLAAARSVLVEEQ